MGISMANFIQQGRLGDAAEEKEGDVFGRTVSAPGDTPMPDRLGGVERIRSASHSPSARSTKCPEGRFSHHSSLPARSPGRERVARGRASLASTGSITCSFRRTLLPTAPSERDAPDTSVGGGSRPTVLDRQVPVPPSGERSPGGRVTFPAEAGSPTSRLKSALKRPKATGDDHSPALSSAPSSAPAPASTATGLRQGAEAGAAGLRQGAARQGSEAKRAPAVQNAQAVPQSARARGGAEAVQRGPAGVPALDLTSSNLQARPPSSCHSMETTSLRPLDMGLQPPE